MNTRMKIGAAVVGGYVLGRRRKAKLAIGLGTWLVGKKLKLDARKLVVDLGNELRSSPQLAELREQLRAELVDSSRDTLGTLITSQTDRLADSLHARTERVRNPGKPGDEERAEGNDESSSDSPEPPTEEPAPAPSGHGPSVASERRSTLAKPVGTGRVTAMPARSSTTRGPRRPTSG